VLLKNGCICCSVRGDLVDTLASLAARRSAGKIEPFRRVLIESTGLADPAPILQILMSAPELAGRYRVERVIATVDAANAESQLKTQFESAKQAALADRLVLTKTDLVPSATVARVEALLASLNPRAPILIAIQGEVAPQHLFLHEEASGAYTRAADELSPLDHDHADPADGHASHHGIDSFALTHDAPIAWETLSAWLVSIASLRGADFLRLKGIVNVAGRAGPVVIDGVQHVFHPPRELARWPDADRRTRIVFIVRDIPRAAVEASFAAVIGAER